MKTETLKTLENMLPGQSGVIQTVGNSSPSVKRRLVDMGLTPGTKITVKKVAPFGDPVEVTIRGYELSIRKSDAAMITISDTPPGKNRQTVSKTYGGR